MDLVTHLCEAGGFTEPLARVLVNRGYFDMDAVERFANPSLAMLYDPMTLGGVSSAADRVLDAIDHGEEIVIYGDYDVDGITACALLVYVLRELGAKVTYFIPSRAEHGYGLHVETVNELAARGVDVMITVDCGIGAVEATQCANKLGIDVIITDHHEPKVDESGDECDAALQSSLFDHAIENGAANERFGNFDLVLPPACAVINPKLGHYPFSELAGVGVAFKLAHGIVKLARERNVKNAYSVDLKQHLDLVALGTIADVVPLRDENRILAKHGLAALAHTTKQGLQKLIEISRVRKIDVTTVVFGLAPRLNAAGRLGDASEAVKLLLTSNASEAQVIARDLDQTNRERRKVERETFASAVELFEKDLDGELPEMAKLPGGLHRYVPDGPNVIVLASAEWNPGVVGIVASRMVERYYLPAVIIALQGDRGRGSCRSTRAFHIFDALRRCSSLLEAYGGHRVAAGLTVSQENIDELRVQLDRIAGETLTDEDFVPVFDIDAEVRLRDCGLEFGEQLEAFKPYGQSNPRPAFVVRKVKLVEDPVVLKEKHLKFCVMQDGEYRHIIAFNWACRVQELVMWAQMDVLIHPYLDYYRGTARLELQLIDARESL